MATDIIHIVIADDHPMVIDGIRKMLTPYADDIIISSTYNNGTSLLAEIDKYPTCILLLDMQLPDYIGEDLAPVLLEQQPEVRILIISSVDTASRIKFMMRAGCSGYVLKNINGQELVTAIRAIANGDTYLSEELKNHFLQHIFQHPAPANKASKILLSRREKEILELIIHEYSTKEIASKLYISPFTVENHRKNLFLKLDVKNVAGLVRKALVLGLVQ